MYLVGADLGNVDGELRTFCIIFPDTGCEKTYILIVYRPF